MFDPLIGHLCTRLFLPRFSRFPKPIPWSGWARLVISFYGIVDSRICFSSDPRSSADSRSLRPYYSRVSGNRISTNSFSTDPGDGEGYPYGEGTYRVEARAKSNSTDPYSDPVVDDLEDSLPYLRWASPIDPGSGGSDQDQEVVFTYIDGSTSCGHPRPAWFNPPNSRPPRPIIIRVYPLTLFLSLDLRC